MLLQNDCHFDEARETREEWTDDKLLSAENALGERHKIQEKIQKLGPQQHRQRQDIFKAEDETMEKRDSRIDSLGRPLAQRTETETLLTIRWLLASRLREKGVRPHLQITQTSE